MLDRKGHEVFHEHGGEVERLLTAMESYSELRIGVGVEEDVDDALGEPEARRLISKDFEDGGEVKAEELGLIRGSANS